MRTESVSSQPVSQVSENNDAPKVIEPPKTEIAPRVESDAGRASKLGELQNQASQSKFNHAKLAAVALQTGFDKEATVTKVGDKTVIDAGAGNDNLGVTQNATTGEVTINVNGASKTFSAAESANLVIKAGDGNDTINVAKGVTVRLELEGNDGDDNVEVEKESTTGHTIDGGAGNDTLKAGGGDDTIKGGAGNDKIEARAGKDTVEGGDGDDYINGSTGDDTLAGNAGNDVIYGGDGNDQVKGGAGNDYLEGSKGNDTIEGEDGKDILSGGIGDDTLKGGGGGDVIYTGAGKDNVSGEAGSNKIYAQKDDTVEKNSKDVRNTVVTVQLKGNPGGTGVVVSGSDEFKERVEADLEMLRSSPTGRKMLTSFDQAQKKSSVGVTITETNDYNGYADWENRTDTTKPQPFLTADGKKGTPNNATVSYNTSFMPIFEHSDGTSTEFAPNIILFHEMAHANDFVRGTLRDGEYTGNDAVDNGANVLERVAVGLPIDHDGKSKTKERIDSKHSAGSTENGLRKEMNLEQRRHYLITTMTRV